MTFEYMETFCSPHSLCFLTLLLTAFSIQFRAVGLCNCRGHGSCPETRSIESFDYRPARRVLACEELHRRIESMALVKGITEEHLLDDHMHKCNLIA